MDCQNSNLPRFLLPIGTKVFIQFILDFFLVVDTGLETKHQFKYCTYLMNSLNSKKYVLCFFWGGNEKKVTITTNFGDFYIATLLKWLKLLSIYKNFWNTLKLSYWNQIFVGSFDLPSVQQGLKSGSYHIISLLCDIGDIFEIRPWKG